MASSVWKDGADEKDADAAAAVWEGLKDNYEHTTSCHSEHLPHCLSILDTQRKLLVQETQALAKCRARKREVQDQQRRAREELASRKMQELHVVIRAVDVESPEQLEEQFLDGADLLIFTKAGASQVATQPAKQLSAAEDLAKAELCTGLSDEVASEVAQDFSKLVGHFVASLGDRDMHLNLSRPLADSLPDSGIQGTQLRRALISHLRGGKPQSAPHWTCVRCGETNRNDRAACNNCGTEKRPGPSSSSALASLPQLLSLGRRSSEAILPRRFQSCHGPCKNVHL